MTKKEFQELTGESPEDMFGNDWQNDFAEMAKTEAMAIGLTEDEAELAVDDFLI